MKPVRACVRTCARAHVCDCVHTRPCADLHVWIIQCHVSYEPSLSKQNSTDDATQIYIPVLIKHKLVLFIFSPSRSSSLFNLHAHTCKHTYHGSSAIPQRLQARATGRNTCNKNLTQASLIQPPFCQCSSRAETTTCCKLSHTWHKGLWEVTRQLKLEHHPWENKDTHDTHADTPTHTDIHIYIRTYQHTHTYIFLCAYKHSYTGKS